MGDEANADHMWNMMFAQVVQYMGGDKGFGKSKSQQRIANGEKIYHGILHYFNAEKNAGKIYSRACFEEHGQEVYAFRNVLEECGAGVGDEIAFFLHWSSKGQAQISMPALRIASSIENNLVLKGTFKKPKDESKDFGFIECWETGEFFGRDVYVPANLCEGLEAGMHVAFNCTLNTDGMPNCRVVCMCEENYSAMPGDLSMTGEVPGFTKGKGKWPKGKSKGVGGTSQLTEMAQTMEAMGMPKEAVFAMMAKGGKGSHPGSSSGGKGGPYFGARKPNPTGRFLTGFVKSYNPNNNYGFIECPEVKAEYGCDVFAGGEILANYSPGDSVTFQLGVNDVGKPQAMDVTPGDA